VGKYCDKRVLKGMMRFQLFREYMNIVNVYYTDCIFEPTNVCMYVYIYMYGTWGSVVVKALHY